MNINLISMKILIFGLLRILFIYKNLKERINNEKEQGKQIDLLKNQTLSIIHKIKRKQANQANQSIGRQMNQIIKFYHKIDQIAFEYLAQELLQKQHKIQLSQNKQYLESQKQIYVKFFQKLNMPILENQVMGQFYKQSSKMKNF